MTKRNRDYDIEEEINKVEDDERFLDESDWEENTWM
jgi:hypothetical protein